ncbi:uncharacterized protein LOC132305039 [Cornus florida]|uniref:uncharacterized protein LOC132305039 n=1 Tax=Cornus florida TaxID=4283 RepID=UPI002899855D|nr:uncharacterized protein LOC132305039 [Cornus florida]
MPFGLKNAGATYQRAMTAIFHNMLHHTVEDYVDDLVVKSKQREDHLQDLRQVAAIHNNLGEWQLAFDESSTSKGGGVEIVLTSPTQQVIVAFKLAFHFSNNEAKYEALILGLLVALDKGILRLYIYRDSKLVIKQVTSEYAIHEPSLTSYRTIIQKLLTKFPFVRFTYVPRSSNRYPDALATLASKITIADHTTQVHITKCINLATITELFPAMSVSNDDWRAPIINQLKQRARLLPVMQLKLF